MTRTIPEPIHSSPNFSTTSMIGGLTIDSFFDQITLGPRIWRFLDGLRFGIWYKSGPEAQPLPPGHLGLCYFGGKILLNRPMSRHETNEGTSFTVRGFGNISSASSPGHDDRKYLGWCHQENPHFCLGEAGECCLMYV
ncbi:hypothetical protein AVEN_85167-1 [Araneus ventricosus]|uniref:Uncharacterized protein n=1 Tax=Araneus ventricosus TaxID=182803 RepID=A0A4Y2I7V9_ARAVE|nr:hypothetical protein AVEN_85167-1 [Araneus ventricosus]